MTERGVLPELHLPQAPANTSRLAAARVNSVAELVGNTPLLRLRNLTRHLPAAVEVYAKAEWYNPSGSVKDRPALGIIRAAEASGQLTKDKVLLDSTSGNM